MDEALEAVLSPDNARRAAAEAALEATPLVQLLPALAAAVKTADAAAKQQLAAVLLRRCVHSRWKEAIENESSSSVMEVQLQQLQQQTIETLLDAVRSVHNVAVQKCAADAVAELWLKSSPRSMNDSPCQAVLAWLSPQGEQQQSAAAVGAADAAAWWRLCDRVAEDEEVGKTFVLQVSGLLAKRMEQTLLLLSSLQEQQQQLCTASEAAAFHDTLVQLCVGCMQTLNSCLNRVSGAGTSAAATTAAKQFYSLALPTVAVLTNVGPRGAASLLSAAENLVDQNARFFRGQQAQLLLLAQRISRSKKSESEDFLFNDEARTCALRLAVTALVAAPRWTKQNMGRVLALVEALFECCCEEQTDEESWQLQEREEAAEDVAEVNIQQESLQLISLLLQKTRSKELTAAVLHLVNVALKGKNNWEHQWAALLLLTELLDDEDSAALDLSISAADWILESCLERFFQTSCPARLRWGALRCFCSLLQQQQQQCESATAEMASKKEEFSERDKRVLELLLHALQQEQVTRCRRKGLQALSLFFTRFVPEESEEDSSGASASTSDSVTSNQRNNAALFPYIEDVLRHVVIPLCDSDDPHTQELAIALASVLAQVSGSRFVPFYSFFMGAMKRLLALDIVGSDISSTQQRSLPFLLEAAVEFAGVLAVAVGPQVFLPDAPWLIQRFLELQQLSSHTSSTNALEKSAGVSLQVAAVEALGQIAGLLGDEILPFLDQLSSLVLAKVQQHVELRYAENVGSSDGEETAGATVSKTGCLATVRITDKTGMETSIFIDTAAIEEKMTAIKLLKKLGEKLGDKLPAPVACAWLSAALTECEAKFELIRKAAFQTIPPLLKALEKKAFNSFVDYTGRALLTSCAALSTCNREAAAAVSAAAAVAALTEVILPVLTKILELLIYNKRQFLAAKEAAALRPTEPTQTKIEASSAAVDLLFQSLEERDQFLHAVFAGMGKLILPILTSEFESLSPKELNKDDDWESIEEDDEAEEAGEAYDACMQCVGVLLKLFNEACMRPFEEHLKLPYTALLTHEHANQEGKTAALCLFGDVINYGGEEAAKAHAQMFVPAALLAVCPPDHKYNEENALAVSAAAYGLGALVVHARTQLLPHFGDIRLALSTALQQLLHQSSQAPTAAATSAAADCVACALLKLLLFMPEQFGSSAPDDAATALADLLHNAFPLKEDEQEKEAACELLLSMVFERHQLLQHAAVQLQVQRLLTHYLLTNTPSDNEGSDSELLYNTLRLRRALALLRS